nr:radical SAM protein [Dehalococcoidales bacterium]
MSVLSSLKGLFAQAEPVQPGVYHYRSPMDAPNRYRLHLRVESDGSGVLIVNASTVLHLNVTATEYARFMIDGVSVAESAERMSRRYRVAREAAEADARRLRETIDKLLSAEDVCPITYLDINRIEPFQTPSSAPYRVDLALTYRCDNQCAHCYVERPRDTAELSTGDWRKAMDRLWAVGVPHLCFTGGEATLRDDLETLITYAEDVGFVTGLLTNGRRLGDRAYLDSLVAAGLDHVQITLESHDEAVHNAMVGSPAWRETVQGVRNSVDADLYVLTNTTLTRANLANIQRTVDFIADLGVPAFACNGLIYSGLGKEYDAGIPEAELADVLSEVAEAAERNNLRFIWYTPTQYCHLNPVELQMGIKSCTAAKYNVCVEPNGDVIPCQSYYRPLGNALRNEWSDIWNHPIARGLR